ncbi:MAG: 23S rRNA (pseudouridine(1915)-N(3))-methyltransferase RlmH [Candidatus Nomurabacteria bacterium]|nr:23S rRNA (pseudouridine(1915)-N(3))-methyltransferase RlmH [Candidatus Nomurabacteria bacterium]
MITIVSVGKKHEYEAAVEAYQKRLRAPFNVRWVLIPNSPENGAGAQKTESQAIFKAVKQSDLVILLDERGEMITSPEFSRLLSNSFAGTVPAKIVIGGAYGVSDELRKRADKVVSFGRMVMPHQLMRLVLIEQLYRAQTIAGGHPYHHS